MWEYKICTTPFNYLPMTFGKSKPLKPLPSVHLLGNETPRFVGGGGVGAGLAVCSLA